jgi:hypothetical protein
VGWIPSWKSFQVKMEQAVSWREEDWDYTRFGPISSEGVRDVSMDEAELTKARVTDVGKAHFRKTVSDFEQELLRRATKIAEVSKPEAHPLEVAQQHVYEAALELSAKLVRPRLSKWQIAFWVLEYILFAAAGAAGNHLNTSLGIIAFAIILVVAVLLVVVRLTRR